MATTRRLAEFDARDNGITAVRLGLALTVVVSHSVSLGGYGLEPLVAVSGGTSLGFVAVIGFFALSGFLLARSRERTPVVVFLRNRALRILPGYWVALVFAALVAVPLAAVIRGVPYDVGAAFDWIGPRTLFLSGPGDETLNAAFAGGWINHSLWTLVIEMACYACLACTPQRWLRPVVLGELSLVGLWMAQPGLQAPGTALLLAFVCGVAAWSWRAWIPMTGWTTALVGCAAAAALLLGSLPVATVLVAYTALGLAWLPVHVDRDLSLGVYVLAYPVQQVLVAAGMAAVGLPVLLALTLGIVLPLAFASWQLIERPALSLRTRRPAIVGQRAPVAMSEVPQGA